MGKEPQCLKPSVVSQHAVPSRCVSAAFPCPPVSSVHEQNKSLMVLVAFLALFFRCLDCAFDPHSHFIETQQDPSGMASKMFL